MLSPRLSMYKTIFGSEIPMCDTQDIINKNVNEAMFFVLEYPLISIVLWKNEKYDSHIDKFKKKFYNILKRHCQNND